MQATNAERIDEIERSLVSSFPQDHASPLVSRARGLGNWQQIERQADHESCSYVAVANALRVLDGLKPEYTKDSLKSRLEQILRGRLGAQAHISHQITQEDLAEIFSSRQLFDKFGTTGVRTMLELLQEFDRGDVGILDWPYSPYHTLQYGVDYTHARTLSGFTINNSRLFFHVIDPYEAIERPWSFRDLVVAKATSFREVLEQGIQNADGIATWVWVVGKNAPPIRTVQTERI